MSPSDFYNALITDPFYVMQKAYLDSTGTLASETLSNDTANKTAENNLANQRIAYNLGTTQLNITNSLADRQATESGDNAYYHNQASTLAGFDTQSDNLQLQDYLAGVQAAYAQGVLDRQNAQNTDLYNAYQNQYQYYSNLNQGQAPPPDPTPPPAPPAAPPAPPADPNSIAQAKQQLGYGTSQPWTSGL